MIKIIGIFVFWYPAIMSLAWIVGGVIFYLSNERKKTLPLNETPMVSVLVPCYNEENTIADTVEQLSKIEYPSYEIIVINDGSSDNTSEVVKGLLEKYDKLRFIDLKDNKGKANALYLGLIASKGEILMGVDSDSYIMPDALNYIVPHFTNPNNGERVGAVTGNPRVRNRSSLLAKLQLCEYSTIISLIKRTQRIWGKVMTVSGVCVAFRKRALLDCKLWDRDMITEDIGVTWKLEKHFWDVRYEPKALSMMLVPETIKGIYKQRKRWAQGGMEILRRHKGIFTSWKTRRMTPVYMEQILSIIWAICWIFTTVFSVFDIVAGKGFFWQNFMVRNMFLTSICLVQFVLGMSLDRKYDKNLFRNVFIVVWYPFLYWHLNAFVTLVSIPSLFKSRKKTATWDSPDRGL